MQKATTVEVEAFAGYSGCRCVMVARHGAGIAALLVYSVYAIGVLAKSFVGLLDFIPTTPHLMAIF